MQIIEDSLAAVCYLHGCGIVHTDIKAANFFLGGEKSSEYKVKLGDFGESVQACATTAKTTVSSTSNENKITDERFRAGTLPFNAPELFGDKVKPTKQSDIYRYV